MILLRIWTPCTYNAVHSYQLGKTVVTPLIMIKKKLLNLYMFQLYLLPIPLLMVLLELLSFPSIKAGRSGGVKRQISWKQTLRKNTFPWNKSITEYNTIQHLIIERNTTFTFWNCKVPGFDSQTYCLNDEE